MDCSLDSEVYNMKEILDDFSDSVSICCFSFLAGKINASKCWCSMTDENWTTSCLSLL